MDESKKGVYEGGPFPPETYDPAVLPDHDRDFIDEAGILQFSNALVAPENSTDDGALSQASNLFITALNDWRPVHQRVRGKRKGQEARKRKTPRRGKDETREGFVYTLLKWPLLLVVVVWLFSLGTAYLATRLYIWVYEQYFTWRGRRQHLRQNLQATTNYDDWVKAAKELDVFLGNEAWKGNNEYAYYNHHTVAKAHSQIKKARLRAEADEKKEQNGVDHAPGSRGVDELRGLIETTVKNNFVGIENPRLYSQTYYGTKDLVQEFVDEVEASLELLNRTTQISSEEKASLFQHADTNFGRTALCLSGGATFAYYHFGVVRALLDAKLLPEVITGTSGGALVAALVATRKDEELEKLLVPALATRITACHDDFQTWAKRWYRSGARFDSLDWARRSCWFTMGNMTFREAYERTGRILNVTCVPSDPHSPTILANHLTSPDCVIWSAVMASAAVPGILNPVVLMMKRRDGTLGPYSFGHKWKDGSLRTDIPIKALNLHFNVNFSIVSQVNPHINLFFFSSRGSVGRPVTHRKGRGWRGGFLGSAVEQYIKLDLNKWLKVLRHLELLPRPLGQDWSQVWLQRFSGTITIWPKTILSDFYYILSDPSPQRLARMLHVGQQCTFPKLKFIDNRMKIERLVVQGRMANRLVSKPNSLPPGGTGLRTILSEDDLQGMLNEARRTKNPVVTPPVSLTPNLTVSQQSAPGSPSFGRRLTDWWNRSSPRSISRAGSEDGILNQQRSTHDFAPHTLSGNDPSSGLGLGLGVRQRRDSRSGSVISEIGRQSRVFLDDSEAEDTEASAAEEHSATEDEEAVDDFEDGGTMDAVDPTKDGKVE